MKPIEELQKIAVALQALAGSRASFELFQDPTLHTALLKVEQDSRFSGRVLLKTTDIRQLPVTLTNLLSAAPAPVTCQTPAELDEALANFVTSTGMSELLSEIMAA